MTTVDVSDKPVPYAAYPPFPVRRFTVDEYLRMIETGVLTEVDKVELLEGWIVPKMPRNPPHDSAIMKITRKLLPILPPGYLLFPQCGMSMTESVPEPDFMIVQGDEDQFSDVRPGPREVAIVIEVSDSTLDFDRDDKGPIYAEAGIPIYWIVNIPESRVEVYSDPSGPMAEPEYRKHRDFAVEASVPVLLRRKIVARIPVRDLLP